MRQSAFFLSEACFWHTTGEAVLTAPVGGWLQPMAAGGHAESPESKRRMRNLMDRSGLLSQLVQRDADPASAAEIGAVHDAGYLAEFKALSDKCGGMLGISAPFGHGSFEIACQSAGLAREALLSVLRGEYDTAYALTRPGWRNGSSFSTGMFITVTGRRLFSMRILTSIPCRSTRPTCSQQATPGWRIAVPVPARVPTPTCRCRRDAGTRPISTPCAVWRCR